MRLFIAVRLPPEAATAAMAVLPEAPALRRVQPELMHVTLAFLGAVPDERLDDVVAASRDAARQTAPFQVTLDHVGSFPSSGLPHVAWLGIGWGSVEVSALAAALRSGLKDRAIAFDEKPFRAHVALGRVRERADRDEARAVASALKEAKFSPISFHANTLSVVESKLSPKGPRYTDRATEPFEVGRKR